MTDRDCLLARFSKADDTMTATAADETVLTDGIRVTDDAKGVTGPQVTKEFADIVNTEHMLKADDPSAADNTTRDDDSRAEYGAELENSAEWKDSANLRQTVDWKDTEQFEQIDRVDRSIRDVDTARQDSITTLNNSIRSFTTMRAQTVPNVGQRLLPTTIDKIAREDPYRTCFSIPLNGSSTDDYVDITYARFANAINRLSWWLKGTKGKSESLETLCYLGPSDLLYFVFAIAACKCGYKVSDSKMELNRMYHADF